MEDNNNTFDTFNYERQFYLDIVDFNFCSRKEFCLALNDFCFLRNIKKPNMGVDKKMGGWSYFHILVKWGVIIKCYGGWKVSKMQYDPPLQAEKSNNKTLVFWHPGLTFIFANFLIKAAMHNRISYFKNDIFPDK